MNHQRKRCSSIQNLIPKSGADYQPPPPPPPPPPPEKPPPEEPLDQEEDEPTLELEVGAMLDTLMELAKLLYSAALT